MGLCGFGQDEALVDDHLDVAARGSAEQLLVNLFGMIAAGSVVLVLQRWTWRRWGRLVWFNARGRLVKPGS